MRHDRWQHSRWQRAVLFCGLSGVLWSSSLLTPQGFPRFTGLHATQVQAQEAAKGHEHGGHAGHANLAPFMIRNAYHLSTLYHASHAAQWELAAHAVEALGENLAQAADATPMFAASLRDFKRDHVETLEKAVEARQIQPFSAAFRAAVEGCNDCHKATKHAYIVIPESPPNLSIFSLPPASGSPDRAPKAPRNPPHQGHQH